MSAPDRPTREQIDAVPHKAAALLLAAARPDPTLRTAARQVQDALIALDDEVRALRAELDGLRIGLDVETRRADDWQRVADGLAEDAARAAGVARTPQPDEVDAVRAELYEFAPPPWEAINYEVHAGGELLFEALGERSHEENSRIADVVVRFFNAAAPLPAVPDGEDAACMNCGLPLGSPEAWGQAQVGPVHHGCPDDVADGEDVPARLDAAASVAVGDLVEYAEDGGVLGKVTAVIAGKVAVDFPNGVATGAPSEFVVVRAAALARPTERER